MADLIERRKKRFEPYKRRYMIRCRWKGSEGRGRHGADQSDWMLASLETPALLSSIDYNWSDGKMGELLLSLLRLAKI